MQGTCPACGIARTRWPPPQGENTPPDGSPGGSRRRAGLAAFLAGVPERTRTAVFWGRVLLLALVFVWGAGFVVGGIDWRAIGGSFLHGVNLPFHELGHLVFSPFGEFLTLLGGSLFQVLVPIILMAAFVIGRGDNFAAAIMLWWCGQNFIDISPYIADAPYRAIPLIFGLGEGQHDWGRLLAMTDITASAQAIAGTSFAVGSLLMMASYLWGGHVLYLQSKRLA